MQSQDVASHPDHPPVDGPAVDVEQAEAALVEHYTRLVRLAYLVLPPGLGRHRRVLRAHALTQRALPRGRARALEPSVPGPRQAGGGRGAGPGYGLVRERVVRLSLQAGLPLLRFAVPKRAQLPPPLPLVWGLRLTPRSGGADELALDQRLAALSGPGRAAYALRVLEGLTEEETLRVLDAAGADDPDAALDEAGDPKDDRAAALLRSPEFDPCSLRARPTDLMRRRQHRKAALAAAVAAVLCGALLGLPGDGWGPDGPAAPPYARNPAQEAALDPAKVTTAAATAWHSSTRRDFSVWPARGDAVGDKALLRRALAVWARPGGSVHVSATPGTASGAPAGPAQLLYAGTVDGTRVVLFYDGLRVVRYAEPKGGEGTTALDFARVDGATEDEAGALVVDRSDTNVRFLTAPWVRGARVRDLLKPEAEPQPLDSGGDGVSAPVPGPPQSGECGSWNVLQLGDGASPPLLTDLGELVPARLTDGSPGDVRGSVGAAALTDWQHTACSLGALRGHGVRTVNSWPYADQELPEANGTAKWLCTRAETWRGTGSRVLAQFLAPKHPMASPVAEAQDSAACGERGSGVLAGVLWKSKGGDWYLLAAANRSVTSVSASGDVDGTAHGPVLALPAKQGAQARLKGTLAGGGELAPLS
ncbi:hypothetical protein [Streptomyces sp. NPDC050560]|uniref:hypothetical protein n=1 Tax=Streptomyces sp. NPDC050560 TaxID=3365630 RepID=UPI0037B66605